MKKLESALKRVREEEATYMSREPEISSKIPSPRVNKFFDRKDTKMSEWMQFISDNQEQWDKAYLRLSKVDPDNFQSTLYKVWFKGASDKVCTIKNALGRYDIRDGMWEHDKVNYLKGKLDYVIIYLKNDITIELEMRP